MWHNKHLNFLPHQDIGKMSSETTADTPDQVQEPAPDAPEDDGARRVTVVWTPTRPILNYLSALVLFGLVVQLFREYVMNPDIPTTGSGVVAILVIMAVILRLLIGATSKTKTVLDLDAKTLTVMVRRLGFSSKKVYKPRQMTHVFLRRQKAPSSLDKQLANSELLTLSLYSYDLDTEIRCAQGFSHAEMMAFAQLVADEFDVEFDKEIREQKAINPFWPE